MGKDAHCNLCHMSFPVPRPRPFVLDFFGPGGPGEPTLLLLCVCVCSF